MEVEPTDTIADVKNKINDQEQIFLEEELTIIFSDEYVQMLMVNNQNLSNFNIEHGSTLLIICLPTQFVMAIVVIPWIKHTFFIFYAEPFPNLAEPFPNLTEPFPNLTEPILNLNLV